MHKLLIIFLTTFVPVSVSFADISIKTDKLELSEDCISYESDRVRIESEECASKHHKNKKDRSSQGKNNPGKGHGKKK